jgi:hypothetical protein
MGSPQNSVAIVIPLYKLSLNSYEEKSLQQALHIFRARPIIFLVPRRFQGILIDHLPYLELKNTTFQYVDDYHLSSIATYNRLLLTQEFYELFVAYTYILIYQLDAYVFTDQLDWWTSKNYDYIGGRIYAHNTIYDKRNIRCTGVGGFSLRKVQSFIAAIQKDKKIFFLCDLKDAVQPFNWKGKLPRYFQFLICYFLCRLKVSSKNSGLEYLGLSINEDIVFGQYVPKYYPTFKVVPEDEALLFCIDQYVKEELRSLQGKMPFGAHAWWTSPDNLSAWHPYIYL